MEFLSTSVSVLCFELLGTYEIKRSTLQSEIEAENHPQIIALSR